MRTLCSTRTVGMAVLSGTLVLRKSSCSTSHEVTSPLRPDSEIYERIDERLLQSDQFKWWIKKNAVHDTLKGRGMIEHYEVYKHTKNNEIVAIVKFGDSLNGFPHVLHGGITSTIFDNTFGWLFFALGIPSAMTANLTVNFRKPLPENSLVLVRARLDGREGRKIFMSASLENIDGNILAESTSLFITLTPVEPASPRP